MIKTAIFLGAGASKADKAPIQSELFNDYFNIPSHVLNRNPQGMNEEIKSFFMDIFNINVDKHDKKEYPTFEEVLGMIDLAELRNESFRNYQLENSFGFNERIRKMRLYFVLLMARVLDYKLRQTNHVHEKLVQQLDRLDLLSNTCFISTNYDILIDNALSNLYRSNYGKKELDYSIDFTNFDKPNDWKRPSVDAIKLLKLHGSLNWLYCPSCSSVTLTQYEKGIMSLLEDRHQAKCDNCNTIRMPIIVPPTFYKDMSNIFLSSVWNKAEKYLSQVDHIVFCGYSLPDADIHIKYLLKRIQTNRNGNLRITVLNHFSGKSFTYMNEEIRRYLKFFGVQVEYLPFGFEDFAENPQKFLMRNESGSITYYNKLIRDKIPQIIQVNGKKANVRVLDHEEYKNMLDKKLQEELNKYLTANDEHQVEELADILEVVYAILESKGVSIEEFEKVRLAKKDDRGWFKEKLLLISVSEGL